MKLIEDVKERFQGKKTLLLFGAGLLGLVLILMSEFLPASGGTVKSQPVDTTAYVEKLQRELQAMVEQIDGAGDCTVVVTLEQGTEYVYATENRKNTNTTSDNLTDGKQRSEEQNDYQDSYIIIRNQDGSESPVLIKELSPVVKGVVVLCRGAEDLTVQQRVMEAVTTALNIKSNRVTVIKKS